MTYNHPTHAEVAQALNYLEVGLVMIGYRMKPREIEYIVDNSDAKVLIFWHEFADRILPHRGNSGKVLPDGRGYQGVLQGADGEPQDPGSHPPQRRNSKDPHREDTEKGTPRAAQGSVDRGVRIRSEVVTHKDIRQFASPVPQLRRPARQKTRASQPTDRRPVQAGFPCLSQYPLRSLVGIPMHKKCCLFGSQSVPRTTCRR